MGAKNKCHNCLHHIDYFKFKNTDIYTDYNKVYSNPCKYEIANENYTMQDVEKCEKYLPNKGFQIGGYITNIHFEPTYEPEYNTCMEMVIHSDGEFPREERERMIVFHICDFTQIEDFVKTWGKYFRSRGIIKDDEK